jgi:glutaredoxin
MDEFDRRARPGTGRQGRLVKRLVRSLLVLVGLVLAFGCKQHEGAGDAKPASAAPKSSALPELTVKPDTPNLLLTWIDEKGDFHVVQKPADVPVEGRKSVRVVQADKEAGTGDLVYVANLDETTPDGAYRLKTMTRAQWDELGASRRKARLEALAPSAVPPPAASVATNTGPRQANPNGKVVAIIYGANWCKPCHMAADYLQAHGVTVVHKDIEESEAAQAEMQQKLARAGRGGASIPVIDIMGQILVGYSPAALDNAIKSAQGAKAL